MKRYYTVVMVGMILNALAVCVNGAFAEKLEWDRNAEADMKEYGVYFCTPNPTCTVVQNAASLLFTVPQTAIGIKPTATIPANTTGKFAVSAKDLTGNESTLSASVPFDPTAPQVPANLHIIP